MTVQLLYDRRRELAPRVLAAVSEGVASILNQARNGTVAACVRPLGGEAAVTVVASTQGNPDEPTFIEFSERSTDV